ncbi:MAG TPA: hypothetical protein VI612_04120 [Candidatus Nanoarchaeia archaeon]|nr:hypothetical protein [Candidatus Nanoarchaeia archaeon]
MRSFHKKGVDARAISLIFVSFVLVVGIVGVNMLLSFKTSGSETKVIEGSLQAVELERFFADFIEERRPYLSGASKDDIDNWLVQALNKNYIVFTYEPCEVNPGSIVCKVQISEKEPFGASVVDHQMKAFVASPDYKVLPVELYIGKYLEVEGVD